MIVEALVRWTEMRFKNPENDEEIKLKRILGEEEPEEAMVQAEMRHEYSEMTFDMDDVARFNVSNDKSLTTVRFKDGDAYVVMCPYTDFQHLYEQCTGKSILTIIEKPKKNKKKGDI